MSNLLLKVDDLSISFKSEEGVNSALRHVSFSLEKGKTLAIVGESGSGKSISSLSLMHLLLSANVRFDSGQFSFYGQWNSGEKNDDILVLRPDDDRIDLLRGRGIAMIFQEPMTALNPVMKCGEQVSEMIMRHKGIPRSEAKRRTLQLFERVRLPRPEAMLNAYPHELSGGQRQRVMIAMAISCEPKILVADEPTTALDVTVQQGILELLKELQVEKEMAMIFITHDLGVVADIADDILVMKRGDVVEFGKASTVLANPSHPYTKGLLACRPVPGMKPPRLQTIEDFTSQKDSKEHTLTERNYRTFEENILEVKSLNKIYGGKKGLFKKAGADVIAVNDVSFEIRKGETLGLVGESGCGKTTLSRMLLGLIPSTSGKIIFDGKDVTALSNKEMQAMRKRMQIIFQDPYSSLNPKLTVGRSLTEPMEVYHMHGSHTGRKNKACGLLEKVGLNASVFDRYPHEFSGGQRQRIVIARALGLEPEFIICDESVSALDVSVQAQVLNLLNDLKAEFGLTYLFISHDLGVVYYMSDHIMVMNKGKIEELGTSDEVFFHPKSEYTRRLIDAIPGKKASV